MSNNRSHRPDTTAASTAGVAEAAGNRWPEGLQRILDECAGLDELARFHRVHQAIREAASLSVEHQQMLRNAFKQADLIGPRDFNSALKEARGRQEMEARQQREEAVAGDQDTGGRLPIDACNNPEAIRKIKDAVRDGALPDVYVTDGSLVQIERVSGTPALAGDDDAPLPIRSVLLTPELLASGLAHHTYTTMVTQFGRQEWTPPQQVLKSVLAGAEWPDVPTLAGIVGMPVLRQDGTLLQDEGYDERTGLYLAPTVKLPAIPAKPTAEEVKAAKAFLLGRLLKDFEWEDSASRANYIGLLVTPFLRRYLRRLSPLGIVSATAPGAGKTILTGVIGLLTGQRVLPWPDDDAELRKVITAVFETEAGAVVFDNLAEGAVIKSPILANLLTNEKWSDRILGSSTTRSWPNERLWLATGNNLRVGGDMARRSVLVKLAPRAPHPEERTGFAIPDLDAWIIEPDNRVEVLYHVLVLIVDWCNAKAPKALDVPQMGQFTSWAQSVGGFLAFHGIKGFQSNLADMREIDEDDLKWEGFLSMWQTRLGTDKKKARDVFDNAAFIPGDRDPWDGQFLTDDRGLRPRSPVQLGQMLKGHIDRFHGDLRLRSEVDKHDKIALWWAEKYVRENL